MLLKITLLISFILFFIGGTYYFVKKYFEANDLDFTKKSRKITLTVSVVIMILSFTRMMSFLGIYTTTIYFHGNLSGNNGPEVNGELVFFKGKKRFGQVKVSTFFTTVEYDSPGGRKSERIGIGTYYFFSNKFHGSVEIRERLYESVKKRFSTMENKRLEKTMEAGDFIKIDGDPNNCIIYPPRKKFPKYIDVRHNGKRLFSTGTFIK